MGYRYGIIGAGRQGLAAAYDLAVRGEAEIVAFADLDEGASRGAAARLNELVDAGVATGERLDASDGGAVRRFLGSLDAFVGSASWRLNIGLTDAAIDSRTHMVDLGGNQEVVWAQLERHHRAMAAGVTVIPNCGQMPGTGINLMAHVAHRLDPADSVVLYDGGLPQHPEPPWNYRLTFSMDGLTNEYVGLAQFLIEGELVEMPCFEDYELVDVGEPFGTLEAFVTTGGLTTLSRSLAGKVGTLKNKTLRYPGHVAQFKAFRDAGLFEEKPIRVGETEVVPRRVFHALIEPRIRAESGFADVVINRVVGKGMMQGVPTTITLDVIVFPEEVLGFTAMQVATGWHAAVVCHRVVSGLLGPGVIPVEDAIEGEELLAEFGRRRFRISERTERTL